MVVLLESVTDISFVPEVVFMARLDVAGSSIRAGETNTGIDGYFTVLTLEKRRGQGKAKKLIIEYQIFSLLEIIPLFKQRQYDPWMLSNHFASGDFFFFYTDPVR